MAFSRITFNGDHTVFIIDKNNGKVTEVSLEFQKHFLGLVFIGQDFYIGKHPNAIVKHIEVPVVFLSVSTFVNTVLSRASEFTEQKRGVKRAWLSLLPKVMDCVVIAQR